MTTELIVAMDVRNEREAMQLADKLVMADVRWVKIGLELFIAEGPNLVKAMTRAYQFKVMLDLKLHDIPETVRRAVVCAAELKVDMLTVHALGGRKMLEEAATTAKNMASIGSKHIQLLGVTVLTSHDEDDLVDIGFDREPHGTTVADLVHRLFRMADESGLAGVVCSGHEVENLRLNADRELLYVVPGVRPELVGALANRKLDDQKRVVTPKMARDAGATHIVVGRPIRDAADPVAAAKQILAELRAP